MAKKNFSKYPLARVGAICYNMHSFARKGRALIFENREMEIKENYNS